MMSTPNASIPISAPPVPADIFGLIHDLHATITQSIDTALSWDQLNSPPINYTLVRPIVQRFSPSPRTDEEKRSTSASQTSLVPPAREDGGESGVRKGKTDTSGTEVGPSLGDVLYALMANRVQFITLSAGDLSYEPLQTTRAAFCELLAIKILRTYPHPEDEASLVSELVRGYCAFEGAPEDVWASMGDERKEVEATTGSALELAIVSTSKHFLSLPLIQHLMNQIYSGHLIYSPISSRSLISDSYVSERNKRRRRPSLFIQDPSRPISTNTAGVDHGRAILDEDDLDEVYVYDPYEAGWLDHQRLKVPKWRKTLEFLSYTILIALFVATLAWRDVYRMTVLEIVYIVFSFGFILEEFAASKEHGWTVYSANAWNAFDLGYIAIFLLYSALRLFGLASHSPNTSDLAFDILAVAACIIFPRLVFFVVKENVVILALRGMVASFISFMTVTILAFSGICFCLWTLGRATWTVKQIVWLMAQIWFGSSYLGFAASESFHPIFGPIVLIGYAALCNVLLITMLIAILSNKFAAINQNAHEEHLFQRVVKTVEGVKSDALFSYLPPVNILAFGILVPLSWICSPRTLHRVNVFAIRLTSFPILIGISAYERWQYRSRYRAIHLKSSTMDRVVDPVQRPGLLDSWLGGGSEVLISSVFEAGPPVSAAATGGNTIFTPPRASSVTALQADDNDDDDDDDDGNGNGNRISKGVASLSRSKAERSRTFDSPLAKLFGRRSAAVPISSTDDNRKGAEKEKEKEKEKAAKAEAEAAEGEVEKLKAELRDVRASQLRMEEMMSKFLAGT